MRKLLFILCVALAGCGAKSNEELAKDLITERLKATLPDFKSYESVDFSGMSTAFLPFEETDVYLQNTSAIRTLKDSVSIIQSKEKSLPQASDTANLNIIKQIEDSVKAKQTSLSGAKSAYTPEKLFKISHAYKWKDPSGTVHTTRTQYYFNKDFKSIIKEKEISNQVEK